MVILKCSTVTLVVMVWIPGPTSAQKMVQELHKRETFHVRRGSSQETMPQMQGKVRWWTLEQFLIILLFVFTPPLDLPPHFTDGVSYDLPHDTGLCQYMHGGTGYKGIGIAGRGGTPNGTMVVTRFSIRTTRWVSFQYGNLNLLLLFGKDPVKTLLEL